MRRRNVFKTGSAVKRPPLDADPLIVALRPQSLGDLTRTGASALERRRARDHPPVTVLDWLSIAVGELPELTARARTVDDVPVRSRTQRAQIRVALLDSLLDALGTAAATVDAARQALVERYPESMADEDDAERYADLVEDAHRSSPRRADMMLSGYAAFLAGAISATSLLSEAEIGAAGGRRWDREDHAGNAELRAAQVHSALANALGGLLAYARLVADDTARLED